MSGNGKNVKGKPSTNGKKGRGSDGKWLKGNGGGPGNPFAGSMAKHRSILIQTATPEDIESAIGVFRDIWTDETQPASARIQAAEKYLTFICGKPKETMELTGEFSVTEFFRAIRDAPLLAG